VETCEGRGTSLYLQVPSYSNQNFYSFLSVCMCMSNSCLSQEAFSHPLRSARILLSTTGLELLQLAASYKGP